VQIFANAFRPQNQTRRLNDVVAQFLIASRLAIVMDGRFTCFHRHPYSRRALNARSSQPQMVHPEVLRCRSAHLVEIDVLRCVTHCRARCRSLHRNARKRSAANQHDDSLRSIVSSMPEEPPTYCNLARTAIACGSWSILANEPQCSVLQASGIDLVVTCVTGPFFSVAKKSPWTCGGRLKSSGCTFHRIRPSSPMYGRMHGGGYRWYRKLIDCVEEVGVNRRADVAPALRPIWIRPGCYIDSGEAAARRTTSVSPIFSQGADERA